MIRQGGIGCGRGLIGYVDEIRHNNHSHLGGEGDCILEGGGGKLSGGIMLRKEPW